MSVIRFLSKDGSRFQLEVAEPLPSKIEISGNDKVTDDSVSLLARAMFDNAHSREATVKGEGNVQRALDIFWNKTKLQERDYCLAQAQQILALQQPTRRTYKLHKARNGGVCYIELGAIFQDLTAADTIGAPTKPVDNDPVLGKIVRYSGSQADAMKALQEGVAAAAREQREFVERKHQARMQEVLRLEDKLLAEEREKASKAQSAHIKDITGYAPGWNANLKL